MCAKLPPRSFGVVIVGGLVGLLLGVASPSLAADASVSQRLAASLEGSLQSGQLAWALVVAGVGGLLTSQTPCVYPLIPITVRYFGGMQGVSRGRVFGLALIYVSGMTGLYAGLGTLFAASNRVFGSYLSSPWVVGSIALFCLLMGLSMLGVFTLQLPAGLNTRLSMVGGQGPVGALSMGLVSGLIAAPCTGPVLLVILTVIAASGALVQGFLLMVAFGIGLGLPFLALALFSGSLRRLPTGGPWMELVKGVLATAMFVVAVYFGRLALPPLTDAMAAVPAAGWLAGILMLAGALVGALGLYRETGGTLRYVAVLALTVGVALGLWGGAGKPSAAGDASARLDAAPAASADEQPPAAIAWRSSHAQSVAHAKASGRPVMIDFTADWCAACKELEEKTYVHPQVRAEAERFVSIKVDATDMDASIQALFEEYGILGLPAVVFIDSHGKALQTPRITGFVGPQKFVQKMRQVD